MQEYAMKIRSLLFGGAALAAVAFMPSQASAQVGASGTCTILQTYTATLGLGGFLNGCFSYSIRELGEDAYLTSGQSIWDGTFTAPSGSNNSTLLGQSIFNDDCGSSGGSGNYAFCATTPAEAAAGYNPVGLEMVFGLNVPDNTYGAGGYWVYSGAESRNGTPPPAGYQDVMLQVTSGGNPIAGEYLFAWEDLNTGCQGPLTGGDTSIDVSNLSNGPFLESNIAGDCSANITTGGNSDSDFNDSMILLNITGNLQQTVTPEPMTMSLMAMGLVGLGGASLRRRRNKK
jgi:hypothetical protein